MLFKAIALFTPGGDLIYSVDANKQVSWHLDLCVALQEIMGLREPPYFLLPAYTATVDRWQDLYTHEVKTVAEIYPLVYRYRYLLNTLFDTPDLVWQQSPWQEEYCNPFILETHREQFPELWQNNHLVIRHQAQKVTLESMSSDEVSPSSLSLKDAQRTYVLRLFVAGNNQLTEKSLGSLYQLLEEKLAHPYSLKIIDITKQPEQAETYQISATPTLIRILPKPVRRIVGDLEDSEKVLQILKTL